MLMMPARSAASAISLGLEVVFGQRLFAEDGLACSTSIMVVGWWMRSGVTLTAASTLSPGQRVLQRREALGDAVGVRKFRRHGCADIDGAGQLDILDLAELPGMLLSHPAGAEYQKTHLVLPFRVSCLAGTPADWVRRLDVRPGPRDERPFRVQADAPVTRQITSPTSSATSSEPSGPTATPTGRPNAVVRRQEAGQDVAGGPDGRPSTKGTKITL